MARVPEEELERIKREVSVQRLAEARGVKLKRHGKDWIGLCCFHSDHEPSLIIDPQRNIWHCLGACQAGGSVIDWVMKAEGVSFRHAVELLRADLPVSGVGPVVKTSKVRRLAAPVSLAAEDRELLRQVVDYYHETLMQSPEALAYLAVDRGLDHPELVACFHLGFANRTLGLRLPMKAWKTGGELRGRLQKLGVFRQSGHEHFNGCVVIPVFDGEGEVAELYGRKITHGLKPGLPKHLYLPGPRQRGVFNLEGLRGAKEVILCEALLDALTFWCAGFRNVTSAYGVEGFTEEHRATLRALGVERVLIAYDRDEAGDAAAEKLARKLSAEGIGCYRVLLPKGMDVNEYAQKVQPATKSLGLVLRHARFMGEGIEPAVVLGVAAAAPLAHEGLDDGASEEALPTGERAGDVAPLATASEVHASERPVTLASAPAAPPEPDGDHVALPAEPLPSVPSLLDASPVPVSSPSSLPAAIVVPCEVKAQEVLLVLGDRRYRVRGLDKNASYEQLRINLLVARGEALHVDTLDLYSARQRAAYVKQAAGELRLDEEVLRHDLTKVLGKLEELQEAQIQNALKPPAPQPTMTAGERAAALSLLEDPHLLDRILEDFAACGVVGEETNKLVGYLAAVSRKLAKPLAVILQSSSAAGKTSLMEAVLAFVPEEERVQYSAMTGQSLFYMSDQDLKHKVLAIVEEEGAERASYALKLLQSEGELSIASTGKDPHTGRLVTHEYKVEGPVAIFLTTTAIDLDEELANRAILLAVDEDREQTRAIHRQQREAETLEGLLAEEDKREVLKLHRNAQRLLRPLAVVNPWARRLEFLDAKTRTRRDHLKYLALIRTLALLRQHQRPKQTTVHRGQTLEYVEATLDDVATANRLAHEVLGRSLDELPPQTRRLLSLLHAAVAEECRRLAVERTDFLFSRRWVREATRWSPEQVRAHLERLVELEYLLVHRGGRGQCFVYELVYDGLGQEGGRFLSGLLDVEALRQRGPDAPTTPPLGGPEGELGGPLGGQTGPLPAGWGGVQEAPQPRRDGRLLDFEPKEPETALLEKKNEKQTVEPETDRTDKLSPRHAGVGRGRR